MPPRSAALTEGPIARTLVVFALPMLAGNVLQSLNGSVNAVWVGRFLGEAALTATSNSNTVMFLLIGSIFGVSMAATILIAQHFGAKRLAEARRVVGSSASFFAAVAVVIGALGVLFSDHILRAMQTPPDALPLAHDYLRIIFVAIPFIFMYSFAMAVLRGAGDSRTPFLFLLLSVGLDIVLNPLLIFGVGPLPRLGIAGSALATLIANVTSLVALLAHLYRKRHPLVLHRGELHLLRIDGAIVRMLVTKGVPMGLQMVVVSVSALLMLGLINQFGSHTTAAFAACMQVWSYVQMPAFAMGAAVSSMAAQNVGAGRWDRVGRTAVAGVSFQTLVTTASVILITVFARPLLGIFLPAESPALATAVHLNMIATWSFILFGITMVLFGVVRSTGAVVAPLVILIVTLWGLRFPLAASLMGRFGEDAIWWSFPASSLLSMLLAIAYYRFGHWRKARMMTAGRPRADA
ncbi:MAG: MATE family efflux transporter [Steroidobacteraceae bacterium]|nr:MATE family efflux transporter [Steroidobacteraceae bacterium]